jgi:rubrerythrin
MKMQQEEAKRMVAILQDAMRMEVEGKEFYQQASQKSGNKLAKGLFQRLAIEEDEHRAKFEEIFQALNKGQDWPAVEPPSWGGKQLKSIFVEATKELGSGTRVAESELVAIKTAMDMENKTYDLYHSRSEQSALPQEKRFYQALAAEERGHYLALVDSHDYLTDPAGWFTRKEHWAMDGA